MSLQSISFLTLPSVTGLVVAWILGCYFGFQIEKEAVIAFCSGWAFTFSLTAAFLVVTIPRGSNKYIAMIDKNLFPPLYSLIMPALWAIFAIVFSSLLKDGTPVSFLAAMGQFCFCASVSTLVWALFVVFRIIRNANESGRAPY